jgi:pyridoxine 4-dehydrogenase
VPSPSFARPVAAGVNDIDTADYYGPHVTNQIVRQALHPYPAGLLIVTELVGRRPPDKSWQPAISPRQPVSGWGILRGSAQTERV